MKAKTLPLLELLSRPDVSFSIPAYQRVYSWRERQCTELWADLMRAARKERTHFLGPVLYTSLSEAELPPGDTNASEPVQQGALSIIDGQQRLTTIMLLMHTLADWLDAKQTTLDDDGAELAGNDLRTRFLWIGGAVSSFIHEGELDEDNGTPTPLGAHTPKLTLSRSDQATFEAVMRSEPLPAQSARAILENIETFTSMMDEEDFNPQSLWQGLRNLTIIAVEVENTQAVSSYFESLNSKGLPLTVADLARNYLLLTENHEEQTRLFTTYWEAMQEIFAPDPGSLRLDSAIRAWLSIRLRGARILGVEQTYSSFKRYVEDKFDGNKESILYELRGFSLMWAENFRYHGVKKFKSSYDWAVNGAPILTAGRPLKLKPGEEELYRKVHEQMDKVDRYW